MSVPVFDIPVKFADKICVEFHFADSSRRTTSTASLVSLIDDGSMKLFESSGSVSNREPADK